MSCKSSTLWYNLSQNFDVNHESRFDKMETGTSYGLYISRIYISASLSIEFVILIGRKWVLFVSLSTMTHMISYPLGTLGRATTKSIAIFSNFHISTSRGWSWPAGLWCLAFTSWHKGHCATYSATLLFMSYLQNFFFKSWYILLLLEWTVYCCLCFFRYSRKYFKTERVLRPNKQSISVFLAHFTKLIT